MSEGVDRIDTTDGRNSDDIPISRATRLVAVLVLYSLAVSVLFHETLFSMVAVWMRSDSYTHNFLILPICLYLAWRLRSYFNGLTVRPEPRALILVLGAGLAWLLANTVDVQVIQHLAYVAVLVFGIWAIVGTAVARCYAFPLGFLFLAVPMGSGLIPPLMEFTADTTEYLLRASGIPVLREGMFLYLPTGSWSIIDECSGVRYVIASVTLGLCYAHLNYNSVWRQLAFVAAAIVVPILANSARAYLVVLAGHLSDMRIGTGNDHILFGWLFFGVVMLLMFWIGSFWQEDTEPPATSPGLDTSSQSLPVLALTLVTSLALLFAATWPAVAVAMNRNDDPVDTVALTIPMAGDSWQAVNGERWRWRPSQRGADRELDQVYASDTAAGPAIVGLHLRQYLQQSQDAELVDTFNSPWRQDADIWRVVGEQRTQIDLNQPMQVAEARITSTHDDLLVWFWYRVDGRNTGHPYLAKILEAKQRVLQGHRQGTRVFIATPLGGDRAQARRILQDFVTGHRAAIEASLDRGIAGSGATSIVSSSEGTGQ